MSDIAFLFVFLKNETDCNNEKRIFAKLYYNYFENSEIFIKQMLTYDIDGVILYIIKQKETAK